MRVFQFLLVLLLHNLNTKEATCQARCEQTKGRTTDTGLTNRALVGHSFKNFTVNKPYDCHRLCFLEKCRCQAYQMMGKHSCELLDEDRFAAPDDFVEEQGYNYYDMNREYQKVERNNACANQPCSNKCCEDNPCSNGGTCIELCEHAKQKFNYMCANGFFGKFCGKKGTSCKQLHLEANKPKSSTVYTLYDPASKSFYQTFCDFTSENGFVWTLLESFSLANKNDFSAQPFFQDHPVNQNSFKWNKFRLPLLIMNSMLNHSTHVRATCNFSTDGLVTKDYLRAKTTDLKILQHNGYWCVKMEYINIRGYGCYNCTAMIYQQTTWHVHTDSHKPTHCQFTSALNGAVAFPSGEDNFGFYHTINRLHRCTSGNNATTQWWFGEQ